MSSRDAFSYAVVRVVPDLQRGEFVNAGILLYCQTLRFLGVAVDLDEAKLLALAPKVDLAGVRTALRGLEPTCAGGGQSADMPMGFRFGWLTAPRSTMVQAGPVHTGLTTDPAADLARLMELLVR